MRATVGVGLGVVTLFIGVFAISEEAQTTESTAMNSSSGGDAWNMSTEIFNSVGVVGSSAVVWMGVAAIVLVSLGILVTSGKKGR